uniref:Uncharacterized protein n=1 Tax=Anguilla anguilla TaxID=7936 RepID=A0A0E9RKT6_ANGAN
MPPYSVHALSLWTAL